MRFLYSVLFFAFNALLTAQRPVVLEDIWQNGALNANSLPGFNFQNDGIHYTRLSGGILDQYDLRTGQKTATLLDAAAIKTDAAGWSGRFDDYTFSPDESKILLATETEAIYRRSKKSFYFVYDRNTQKLTRLCEGPKQRDAAFSPDGAKVAFGMENDLYYTDLSSGKTHRATTDGKINAVINGAADWVYEEEFELVRAFEWSPDGKYLAYLRFDESATPEFTMEMYRGKAYPELTTFKYPKVGEKNADISAHVYELSSGKILPVDTDAAGNTGPDDGADADFYLPRIQWTPDKRLCITRMNRLQNHLQLLLADLSTGRCNTLYEEKNKYYIDLSEAVFLADGSGFILPSEKSGFNHLYHFDMQGREIKALTKGRWDVTNFYGVDEKKGAVFYQAAAVNPMQRELYSVKLNGKSVKRISGAAGHHSAQFSKTFDYFVDNYSTINSPPQYAVYERGGKKVRELEQNRDLQEKQKEYGVAPLTFFNFKTSENVDLNGWILKPTAPAYRDQKLPVLMFVYGGPGSQQAIDQWRGANYWWFQMLAQQGYVVACVDNRGTGARGEAFKKMTYKQLGKYETMDQIEAAKYLGTQSFVDPSRIGIFGWSYGGYMSSLCMLKGADVFKAGIAVAPVTNWKWYDSVYTERYMQTYADNPDGYEENSPNNFAEKLKGNYLLIHGLSDDNVHFQHSAEMARNLIAANKPFDTMIYPNRNHGIGDGKARLHLYNLMTKFLNEKLKTVQNGGVAKP